jgi:hypothetical protein
MERFITVVGCIILTIFICVSNKGVDPFVIEKDEIEQSVVIEDFGD